MFYQRIAASIVTQIRKFIHIILKKGNKRDRQTDRDSIWSLLLNHCQKWSEIFKRERKYTCIHIISILSTHLLTLSNMFFVVFYIWVIRVNFQTLLMFPWYCLKLGKSKFKKLVYYRNIRIVDFVPDHQLYVY